MSPALATDLLERVRVDTGLDTGLNGALEFLDADDELLVEEISIDGMCGVY